MGTAAKSSQEEIVPEVRSTDPELVERPAAPETTVAGARPDPWKTAFIVLVGIVLLSGLLIYSTSGKRTDPATVLQADVNGQPVQPLNPATGVEEDRLASLPADAVIANTNTTVQAGNLPGGDGYNAWANGGAPPSGAPHIGPGGQLMTVPGGGSQFMPPDCILQPSGIYLCPVPTNANAAVKPTPKITPQNANVQPSPTPAANATPKTSPTPAVAKPTPLPKTRQTPATGKPTTAKTPELN